MGSKFISFAFYILLVIASIVIAFVLFDKAGSQSTFQVNLDFNVGEIIAGILGGSGIGIAGIAYAYKSFTKSDRGPQTEDIVNKINRNE